MVKKPWLLGIQTWVCVLTLPFFSCVALDKLLNILLPTPKSLTASSLKDKIFLKNGEIKKKKNLAFPVALTVKRHKVHKRTSFSASHGYYFPSCLSSPNVDNQANSAGPCRHGVTGLQESRPDTSPCAPHHGSKSHLLFWRNTEAESKWCHPFPWSCILVFIGPKESQKVQPHSECADRVASWDFICLLMRHWLFLQLQH